MDLGAWPAGARIAHGPEIILLIHSEKGVRAHTHIVCPDACSFVILAEHGDVELISGDGKIFRDQFPGPGDRLLLEIIAEREIAQHLEKSVMPGRAPHLLQIVVFAAGANALLGGAGAVIVALLAAQKGILELVHAGIREEQRRIIRGDQRGGTHHTMSTAFEEAQKLATNRARIHKGLCRRRLGHLAIVQRIIRVLSPEQWPDGVMISVVGFSR